MFLPTPNRAMAIVVPTGSPVFVVVFGFGDTVIGLFQPPVA